MQLPQSFTTVTRLSKTIALVLFIILPFFSAYVGYKFGKSTTIAPSCVIQTAPTNISTKEIISPSDSTTSSEIDTNRLYLIKNINGEKVNIYTSLPTKSAIKYTGDFSVGSMGAEVTINGQLYGFNVQNGGRGGPCPMTDEDPTHCGYIDKKIDTQKDVTIEAVRIWKDDPQGIFLINPWDINIEKKYNINSILVTKISPNNSFTQKEVDTWLNIFSLINIEKF